MRSEERKTSIQYNSNDLTGQCIVQCHYDTKSSDINRLTDRDWDQESNPASAVRSLFISLNKLKFACTMALEYQFLDKHIYTAPVQILRFAVSLFYLLLNFNTSFVKQWIKILQFSLIN